MLSFSRIAASSSSSPPLALLSGRLMTTATMRASTTAADAGMGMAMTTRRSNSSSSSDTPSAATRTIIITKRTPEKQLKYIPSYKIQPALVNGGYASRAHLTHTERWHVIDAAGQPAGRLATIINHYIMGKHKPIFHPSTVCGDHVVVLNTAHVELFGDKWKKKFYKRHTGVPGGLTEERADKYHERIPTRIVYEAVYNMLPRNNLKKKRLALMHLFENEHHPYGPNITSILRPPEITDSPEANTVKKVLRPGFDYSVDDEDQLRAMLEFASVNGENLFQKIHKDGAEPPVLHSFPLFMSAKDSATKTKLKQQLLKEIEASLRYQNTPEEHVARRAAEVLKELIKEHGKK